MVLLSQKQKMFFDKEKLLPLFFIGKLKPLTHGFSNVQSCVLSKSNQITFTSDNTDHITKLEKNKK